MATYYITTLQTQFKHGGILHYNTTKPVSTWQGTTLQHYKTSFLMATYYITTHKTSFHMPTYYITTIQTQFKHGDLLHDNTTKPVYTWQRNTLQHYKTSLHRATATLQHYKPSFNMATYYITTVQKQFPHADILHYITTNPVSTWGDTLLQHYKPSSHMAT